MRRRSLDRTRGLAFEVEDDEVAARVQHLTEVQVAVHTDPLPAGCPHHVVEALEQLVGAAEDDREVRRVRLGHCGSSERRTRSVCCAVLRIDW